MAVYFEFTEDLHYLLLSLDEHLYGYESDDFDYDELRERVRAVQPCLERVSGYKLNLESMQDCFYVFDLAARKLVELGPGIEGYGALYDVTFSFSGNLTTVGSSCPGITISRETKEETAKCLEEYGFVFLDADVLRKVMYDGKREYFLRERYTWLDRYFGCD